MNDNAITEKYWSRFASDFEEMNNYVVGNTDMEIVKSCVAKQKNLGKTLEIACGNGIFSKILINEAEHLTLTDLSDEMLLAAGKNLKAHSNISINKANCFNLPFPDSTFDTAFMANILHIVSKPEKAIQEAKRVLHDKGRIMVVDFTPEGMPLRSKIALMYRFLKTYGMPPSRENNNLKTKHIKKMLLDQDFEIESTELVGIKTKAIFACAVSNK